MEKRIAHYSLKTIKELIAKKKYVVSLSARQSYTALGLEDDEGMAVKEDAIIISFKERT